MTATGTEVEQLVKRGVGSQAQHTAVADEAIAAAASEIRELHRKSTMDEAAAIGGII